MQKACIEPNIVNWARRQCWSGNQLRECLTRQGMQPHFGIHGIYELSRGLLSQQSCVEVQANFQILCDLDPVFGLEPAALFDKELDLLRAGALVIPVLDALNQASCKYQVSVMADGHLEWEGRAFISAREADISRNHPLITTNQLRTIQSAILAGAERPRTFFDVLTALDPQVPNIIWQILGSRITSSEASRLHLRINEFPALRSAVRANLYLWKIALIDRAAFSGDDDYRHVIEASYADVFVTGDSQLARTAPRINPELVVLEWSQLKTC